MMMMRLSPTSLLYHRLRLGDYYYRYYYYINHNNKCLENSILSTIRHHHHRHCHHPFSRNDGRIVISSSLSLSSLSSHRSSSRCHLVLCRHLYLSHHDHDDDPDNVYDHGPLHDRYDNIRKNNPSYQKDIHQLMALRALERLYRDLIKYPPPSSSTSSTTKDANDHHHHKTSHNNSIWNSWFGSNNNNNNNNNVLVPKTTSTRMIRGVYLHGGVGCGKTFLMNDIFYECVQDTPWHQERHKTHFHSFMLDVHHEMHIARKRGELGNDIVSSVIQNIIQQGKLLCFDEFQVTDVADALLLQRLFDGLWSSGCIVVATSNRPPIDLYKDGLQRDRFLPFIETLQQRCHIVSMWSSETDYRLLMSSSTTSSTTNVGDTKLSPTIAMTDDAATTTTRPTSSSSPKVYFSAMDYLDAAAAKAAADTANGSSSSSNGSSITSNGSNSSSSTTNTQANRLMKQAARLARTEYEELFHRLAGRSGISPTTLQTQGRAVSIPQSSLSRGLAKFRFDDVCMKALGAADYLLIGQTFHTVFLDHIPILTLHHLNYVRRFIIFIDTMYECQVKLIVQAQTDIEHIFQPYDTTNTSTTTTNDQHQHHHYVPTDNIAIDEIYAFDRTKSRLYEMTSMQYLQKQHKRWCGNHAPTDVTMPPTEHRGVVESKASLLSNRRATLNVIPS